MKAIAILVALQQYIINSCIEAAGGQLFPCVKQSVYAVVITADGREYFGANWMTSCDVTVCPRIEQGRTDYELCGTICGQGTEFHAERQAMWSAYYDGADLTGAEVFITGHTYCCDTCRAAMHAEGITFAASLDSGKYYERGEETMVEVIHIDKMTVDSIDIIFDDAPQALVWHRTKMYDEYICFRDGRTTRYNTWHKDGVIYETYHYNKPTYNIYNEPTTVPVLVDHPVGFTFTDGFGELKCALYGAHTAIELLPLIVPEFDEYDFSSDLDEFINF